MSATMAKTATNCDEVTFVRYYLCQYIAYFSRKSKTE